MYLFEQQRHISKTSGLLLFYVENALGICRGKNSGFYTVLEKLSLEAISKFQQSCQTSSKKSCGVEWQ